MGSRDGWGKAVGAGTVLIAPDKFKNSLTAREAATWIAAGIRRSRPGVSLDLCPVADGGDGTLDAAISAGYRRVPVEVEGPVGQLLPAAYGERGGTALIELAEAVGMQRLDGQMLAPLTASTYGAGQLVAAAIRAGNRTIILAIGGSASTDGGSGIVQALGAELLDHEGRQPGRGGGALAGISRIDLSKLRRAIDGVSFILASDVDNPLLGPTGAAAVFGPQKGASRADVEALERGLARWAEVVRESTGVDAAELPGAGAAGGVGFGAMAILGAKVVSGADMVLDMVRFRDRLALADLVITGEGSLDDQSLRGKAPVKVAQAAREAAVPVIAVVGRCTLPESSLDQAGIDRVYSLASLEPDLSRSIVGAGPLLEAIGGQIAAAEIGQMSG
jgi:glycerate 2-kinase